jgi:cytochrome c5
MSTLKLLTASALVGALLVPALAKAEGPGLGQPLSPDEVPMFARYVMPDGRGLPPGGGTAQMGSKIYAAKCAKCHGKTGTEGPVMPPVGPNEVWAKPAGRHWPYATTLFAYIRRAMPFDAPKSLTDDQAYALAAFILYRNGLVGEDEVMDAESLPKVDMPNRDNFVDVWATQGEKPW